MVKLGPYNFEIVIDNTYLGTILTNKNELPETENRITNASRAYDAFLPLQQSRSVSEQKINL